VGKRKSQSVHRKKEVINLPTMERMGSSEETAGFGGSKKGEWGELLVTSVLPSQGGFMEVDKRRRKKAMGAKPAMQSEGLAEKKRGRSTEKCIPFVSGRGRGDKGKWMHRTSSNTRQPKAQSPL